MHKHIRGALAAVFSASGMAANETPRVALDNGCVVTLIRKFPVNVDTARDKHGPAVLRASNDNLLLFHQDSEGHRGGDGFVRQLRSLDNGNTWMKEGPAADWRKQGLDALFAEGACCSDGKLVLFVQRRKALGGGDADIIGAWLQVSHDDGATWVPVGPADPKRPDQFLYGRSVFAVGDRLYVTAWGGRTAPCAFYTSKKDDGEHWEKLSEIFPKDRPAPWMDKRKPFEPSYPNVSPCPDGSFLAIGYGEDPINKNWTRRSLDRGATWGPVAEAAELKYLRAPRLRNLYNGTMMVTGRDIRERATVAFFSTDNGKTWPFKLILDKPRYYGSYAYSDSIRSDAAHFYVFTSSPQSGTPIEPGDTSMGIDMGKGDIIGMMLSITKPGG